MKTQWEIGDKIQCDMTFSPIQLDTANIPDGYIAGIASTTSTDRQGHKVLAKAFDDSIKRKGLAGPKGVQLLVGHNWNKVAGKIKKLDTVKDDLLLEAQLYMDVSYVKDLHVVIKQNGGLSFSVGFSLEEFEFNEEAKGDEDPWLIVKRGDLMEVSIVTFPSQENAVMTFIKQNVDTVDTMAEFERALMADGLCRGRNEAHRIALWAHKNTHLFLPKPPLLVDKVTPSQHPMLDASMLKPMADLIAKARAQLP
jgi:HK97 family phage prohead protease